MSFPKFIFASATLCFFLLYRLPVFGQNLFANPGFEDANVCTEFLARCAPEAWKEANYSRMVYIDNAKGGKIGFILSGEPAMRTYMFTELLCPLVAGELYDISFDMNLRGADFKPFGIFLSTENLSGRFKPKTAQPVAIFTEKNGVKKMKKMDWMPFRGSFTASGGERFFYLGYVEPSEQTPGSGDWMQIFYLDNLKLIPKNKSMALCPEAEAKRVELYADDWRHMGFADTTTPGPQATFDRNVFEEPEVHVEEPPVNAEETPPSETPQQPDTLILAGVCFDFDKSTLNDHYAAVTDSLTDKIALRKPGKVFISGHTDNIGTDEFNLKLSLARAHTIEQILIQKGVEAGKIFCMGEGESRPVATNDTEEGRAANRRIEIVLFFQD